MADKTKEATFLSAKELLAILAEVPADTEIYLEAADVIEQASGAVYFPRVGAMSLVGASTEIDVDEVDWETLKIFGDVGLMDKEAPDYDDNSPPFDTDCSLEVEVAKIEKEKEELGEVSVPLKPNTSV